MTGRANESVDAYLNSVKSNLYHLPLDEQSAILEDLRSHIEEDLKSRCGEAEPAAEDVAAVLATMDPPSAFGPDPAAIAKGPRPVLGKIAFGISIAGAALLAFVVLSAIAISMAAGARIAPVVMISPVLPLQFAALICGLFSRGDKYGRVAIMIALISLATIIVLPIIAIILPVIARAHHG